MRIFVTVALGSAAILAAFAAGPASAAENLVTGSATYELSLAPGTDQIMAGLKGSMTSSLRRVCDRYESDGTMDVTLIGPNGREISLEMTSRYTETAKSLKFDIGGKLGGTTIDEAHGTATRTADGILVALTAPQARTWNYKGDVLFPIAMVSRAIELARAGQRFTHSNIFDGSGQGADVWSVSMVIGDQRKATESDDEKLFASALGMSDLQRWPMKFSYFAPGAAGEQSPSFSMDGVVYTNGFVLGAVYNLNKFAMDLKLVEFKPIPPEPCP